MKKPTPVMTPSIVSDNASSFTANVGAKVPICIQVHSDSRYAAVGLRREVVADVRGDQRRQTDAAHADHRGDALGHALTREREHAEADEREDEDQRNEVHCGHPFIVVAASTSSVRKRR